MERDVVFAAVADERRQIARLIDELDDAQVASPSLCEGWDIKTVAAPRAARQPRRTRGAATAASALLRQITNLRYDRYAVDFGCGDSELTQPLIRMREQQTNYAADFTPASVDWLGAS